MGRVYAISINTFREAVRDRVLYGVLGFATLVLLFALALAELSLNQQARVVSDIGLASVSLFSVVIAVFLGSSLLYKEIERKTLYVILPKPIARWEFLAGKYFGIALTALVFIAIMGAVQLWVTAIQHRGPPVGLAALPLFAVGGLAVLLARKIDVTALLLPWSLLLFVASALLARASGASLWVPVASLALVFGEVLVVSAVALLFSSFSTPFLTGAFTLGIWLVGRSADEMITMRSRELAPALRSLMHGLGRVVPNFNLFVPGRHTLETHVANLGTPLLYVAQTLAYGVLYALVLMVIASLIFRRRDLL
jgi:Cu-processing system permease protein